jgi:hypothetical protein
VLPGNGPAGGSRHVRRTRRGGYKGRPARRRGELTNITGGNLKALLPEPCYLSLPAVADGSDYGLWILDSRLRTQLTFNCHDHPFQVTVLERDEPQRRQGKESE